MESDRYQRLQEVFDAAKVLTGDQRDRLLEIECAGDGLLRREVEGLLAHREVESPTADPLSDRAVEASRRRLEAIGSSAKSAFEERVPERIGNYSIVRCVGEGGMGVVYEALQESPRRRVALKLIPPGLVTRQRLVRFRHETELLGRLHHPGIAQVFEAGVFETGNGRGPQPFFAMEFIDGVNLRTHAERHGLSTKARLELIARVCDAVDHAHKKGVVHRDLKPENILVGPEGHPKVVDFGIARNTDGSSLMLTAVTEGGQIIGTLAYMAPEQLSGDATRIGPHTDVYALGIVAFELLCGRLPLNVAGLPISSALRQIAEGDSVSLGTIDRSFRGDAETIVAKALEKEIARRYAGADEFAADIRRFLDDQPVTARRPSRLYRATKFVRRNRALVAGTVATLLALAGGLGTTAWALVGESRARATAEDKQREADAARAEERRARELADERRLEAEYESYAANISAAEAAAANDEADRLRARLDACPPGLRGWEWRRLSAQADASLAAARVGRDATLAVSPDGGTLLAGHRERTVSLRDAGTLEVRAWAPASEGGDNGAAFSPDGLLLATSGQDGVARIRSASTLETIRVLKGHSQRVHAVAFSPDSRLAATASFDGTAGVWDASSGELLHLIETQGGNLMGIAFSPDGGRLLTSGWLTPAEVWDCNTWERVAEIGADDRASRATAVWSPDGQRIAIARTPVGATLVDAATGVVLAEAVGHTGIVAALAFSPDGRLLATGGHDSTVRLWDSVTAAPRGVLLGHTRSVSAVAFSPDSSRLYSVSGDSTLRVWDTGSPAREPLGTKMVDDAHFSPDGTLIAAATRESIRVLVAHTGRQRATIQTRALRMAFSPDGASLVSATPGSESTIWDVASGESRAELVGHERLLGCLAYSPDGETVITGGFDQTIRLWDARTGAARRVIHTTEPSCEAVAFSPQGDCFATGHNPGVIHLWGVRSLEKIATFAGHDHAVVAITFSRDGNRILSASIDHTGRAWDIRTGECLFVMRGHAQGLFGIGESPDGRRIVTGAGDGTVRMWDAASGRELGSIRCGQSQVLAARFSPDGTRLLIGSPEFVTRPLDSLPARVRYVIDRDPAAASKLIDAWMRECRGESPPTWVSDPLIPIGRPGMLTSTVAATVPW